MLSLKNLKAVDKIILLADYKDDWFTGYLKEKVADYGLNAEVITIGDTRNEPIDFEDKYTAAGYKFNLAKDYALKNGFDYLFWMDGDVFAGPNTVEKMLAATDGYTIVSAMIRLVDKKLGKVFPVHCKDFSHHQLFFFFSHLSTD